MANSLPFLLSMLILLLVFSVIANATSSVQKDLAPCTMFTDCENPCQPLPPPPPPVIECPPPPLPSPPPPSPPPPLPPSIVECPPPPKPSSPCQNNCELPPSPPYPPQSYFPPGTPFPYYVPPDYDRNSGGKMMPFQALHFSNPSSHYVYSTTQCLISVALLCLPYNYLFNLGQLFW